METILFQSGIVSASLQVVLKKFTTYAQKELDLLLGAGNELKKLERTLLKVQALVDNLRTKLHQPHSCSHKAQQLWLRDLQSMLHEADDLLDGIVLDILKLSSDNNVSAASDCNKDQVSNLVLSRFKFSIPSQMAEMQRKLEDLAREMDGNFLDEVVKLTQAQPHSIGKLQTSSLVDKSCVAGREKDKDEVIQLLLAEETEGAGVSVVAIVGMAGLGKTTLAQLVYNDVKVVGKFNLRIWVSISVEHTVERITKSIVECASRQMLELSDLDPIQVRLQEILEGKEFLIVLDGLWNENANDWDILRLPFKVAAQGSRILVTTQSMIVSRIVATDRTYHLQTLSDEDCWELIKQRAFSGRIQNEHKHLMDIGFKMAEKCNGLPLAARVLGSALRFKNDEVEWDALLKSKLWDLSESETQILPALKLSYDHLAPCLKRCFAYCSIFPTNFEFKRDDMAQLWAAEGFVQPKGVRRIEDVGKEYFDVLFLRSFFQFSHLDDHGNQIYRMHNLIYDLAQFVSDEVCLRMEDDMSSPWSNIRNARHSSLLCKDIQPGTLKVFHKCSHLRTFLLLSKGGCNMDQIPYQFFIKLRYIRVLNLSHTNISELPDSVGILKHLRHLDVSYTHIEKLPESITNLLGMETLKLKDCFKLVQLPKQMKNLTNLRHLEFDIKHQINAMPLEFGKLTNLQTLSTFVVGREKGRCIEELKDMRFLQGSICITNLENVANLREAITAKLEQKPYLDRLELQWNVFNQAEQVLSGLEPHNGIKGLTITGYGGLMFPSWLGNPKFCRLERIYLQSCRYCKIFPSLGQLPMLKELHIQEMHDLEYVESASDERGSSSFPTFPSLQSLRFHDMQKLQGWKGLMMGDMLNLSKLTIVDCPNLNSLPALHYLSMLENLEIESCPQLQRLPAGGLPNSLKCLVIIESSILSESCKVRESEDWSKIQSIPRVEIDYEVLVT